MGRTSRIFIINQTGTSLTYIKTKEDHGKFTTSPPYEIKAGATGEFAVSSRDSASVGPKGKVTYTAMIGGRYIEVFIFWDHPFSATTSVYEVGSNPDGKVRYSLTPAFPLGGDQTVQIIIDLQP
jgi:hypothetical protein